MFWGMVSQTINNSITNDWINKGMAKPCLQENKKILHTCPTLQWQMAEASMGDQRKLQEVANFSSWKIRLTNWTLLNPFRVNVPLHSLRDVVKALRCLLYKQRLSKCPTELLAKKSTPAGHYRIYMKHHHQGKRVILGHSRASETSLLPNPHPSNCQHTVVKTKAGKKHLAKMDTIGTSWSRRQNGNALTASFAKYAYGS